MHKYMYVKLKPKMVVDDDYMRKLVNYDKWNLLNA